MWATFNSLAHFAKFETKVRINSDESQNIVTCRPNARERFDKQAYDNYSTKNRADPFLDNERNMYMQQ
jgi:hypothetical protein